MIVGDASAMGASAPRSGRIIFFNRGSGFIVFPFYILVFEMMIAFPLERGSGARAARNLRNFDGLLFSAILIQTADVKTLAGNGHARSDLFPSTHWSVVLAAGRSQAEPEIAQAALAELCQTYWAPLYSFVRSRGYIMHDAQD
ncbi:MAG: hypothetical protein DME55_00550, partial [Verrucomicrobia bacterium]